MQLYELLLAIAQRIAERMGARHGGDRKTDQGGNISTLSDHGKTRDLAAAKAGLGSGKTLEAALLDRKVGGAVRYRELELK